MAKIDLRSIQAELKNITNSSEDKYPLPTSLRAETKLMGAKVFAVQGKANALKDPYDFDMDFKMEGFPLRELNSAFKAYGGFDVEKGTLDVFGEASSAEGKVTGYVKPFIKNLDVVDFKKDMKESGPLSTFWEMIVGGIGGLLHGGKQGAQATRIPIEGTLGKVETDGFSAALSLLRHAFIKPFQEGIGRSVEAKDIHVKGRKR